MQIKSKLADVVEKQTSGSYKKVLLWVWSTVGVKLQKLGGIIKFPFKGNGLP